MTDEPAVVPPEPAEPTEIVEDEGPQSRGVIHASKLMRIASMTRAMLDEVRHAPLDDAGRKRLVEVHERTLEETEEVLTDELREELLDIFMPLSGNDASDSEIRIAQAQLVGWLEGLFAGIQASLFSQQAAAASQLELMRSRAIEGSAGMDPQSSEEPAPGQYL